MWIWEWDRRWPAEDLRVRKPQRMITIWVTSLSGLKVRQTSSFQQPGSRWFSIISVTLCFAPLLRPHLIPMIFTSGLCHQVILVENMVSCGCLLLLPSLSATHSQCVTGCFLLFADRVSTQGSPSLSPGTPRCPPPVGTLPILSACPSNTIFSYPEIADALCRSFPIFVKILSNHQLLVGDFSPLLSFQPSVVPGTIRSWFCQIQIFSDSPGMARRW